MESMNDGFQPTLAIVFISIKQDRKSVCEILHQEEIDIIGATSSGEFIDGYQGEGSIVVLLIDLNRDAYTILYEHIGDKNIADVAKQLALTARQKFKQPAFILCSTGISLKSEYLDGETLVHSIENVVGADVDIFGGMAGDDRSFTGTYVFTYDQTTDKGMAALVLDGEKVDVQGVAISGWKPMGVVRTVTKSEDGWLYSIDGQPALEMYLRYLGKKSSSQEGTQKIFEDIGFFYPFLSIGAGDPVIRTPLLIDQDKNAIKLDFHIPEGRQLQFTMPPDFDIVETVLDNANELKKTTQADAEALLIFSCAGRLSALGPMVNSENEGLQDIWNAPMAGFFTYGEYGKGANGKQQFHSTTCSWVTLKEKY
jgi:hypothetical protein